ncbi:MAG: flagellar hook-basal body complex protein FliE [Geminicoccaceae bacterium]
MDPIVSRALAGYAQTPTPLSRRPTAGAEPQQDQDFASFFRQIAKQSVDAVRSGESASIAGLEGKLDAQSVVEAVAAAELTVQTVTAVRDRIIEAYQELIRMPI